MFGVGGAPYLFMACAISYIFSGHTGIYTTSQKIGVSKSNLINFSHDSTLASLSKREEVKL